MKRLAPWFLLLLSLCAVSRGANRLAVAGASVTVKPGDNLSALVQQQPPGTTFAIKAGVYRLQSIQPKSGDSFVGETGAILSGAQVLSGFTQSGQLWSATTGVAGGPTDRGKCKDEHPGCHYPEDLFIDDAPLERVESLSAVVPGKWYLDYSSNTAYLADNPNGHQVEVSVTPNAFSGSAQNVRIANLTIEKYACLAQFAAVDGRAGSDWVVENNAVELNHGMGVRIGGDGARVVNNKLIHNGQLGIGGGGTNGLVDGNEIAFNNYAGYNYGWEAGGSKFAFTKNLVVRNNYAHDNRGPALWTDIDNENTLYEHNHTKGNLGPGIFHEISYHAVIRDNVVENDAFNDINKSEPWWGAGIVIAASSDVEVYGNTVSHCMNGIVGLQAQRGASAQRGTPYLLRNLYVHDNVITQDQGIAAGIVRDGALGDAVFNFWNNRFSNNQFHMADSNAKLFAWRGAKLSYKDWAAAFNGR